MTDYFDFTIPEPSNPSFLGKKGIQYRGPKVKLGDRVGNIFCGITANQSGPFNKIGTPPDTYYSNSNSKVQIFSSDENNLASWPPEGSIYSKQGIPSQKSVWVIMWHIRDVDGNIYNFAPNYLLGIMVKKTPITWDSDDMSKWNVYLACVPDDDSSPCDNVVLGKVTDYNEKKNTANLYTCDNTNCGSDKNYKKCKGPSPSPTPKPTPGPSPSPTPKPTPGPSPSPTPAPESRGLSTPAIIGISVGGVVLVIGIGLVIMNLIKKKRKGRKK
jgi:hypothetical protein